MPKILVIDDEATIRNGLKELFAADGHTVFVVGNVKAGQKIFQNEGPDIALININMLKIDGIEVLIRFKKLSPKTEIIAITRDRDMKYAIDAIKAGVFDYIKDPINPEELSITIHRALEKQALFQQLIQSERLKALGEIASGVAHNINNILTIVLGHIRLLQSMPKDKGILEDAINVISKSAWDGAQLIRKFQTFSRNNCHKEKFVPLDINYIIRESIEFTKPRWKDEAQFHNVRYSVKCNNLTDAVFVSGNPGEMREVFVNIINNALDAMPEGGELSFSTNINGSKVLISIADTGIGISEELCEKIFEPFFTTKYGKGIGLGLSTAYAIINEHKGAISVRSAAGKGAEFNIKLPIISKSDIEEKSSVTPVDGTEAATVRVIDDEKEICAIVAKVLTGAGHKVLTAQTGKAGIEIFRNNHIDLVLCDLTMPDMSGWDVARTIHNLESKKRHKTPMVIFTGWGDTLEPSKLAKTGVNMVISKPLDNNQLLNIVRQIVHFSDRKNITRILQRQQQIYNENKPEYKPYTRTKQDLQGCAL